jgi:hypothetical protein
MRASLYLTALIDVEVPGDTIEEAVKAAKKLTVSDIVNVKKGEAVDWAISIIGANHDWPSIDRGNTGE